MSNFKVKLKKVVDDSYEIEIGYELEQKLIDDLKAGLVGKISKFVVVTDSNVKELYAYKIYKMLEEAGYKADLISFPAGELSKTRATKEYVEDTMLAKGYRRRLLHYRRWRWCGDRSCRICSRNLWQRNSIYQLCNDVTCGRGCIRGRKDSGRYTACNQSDRTV